MTVSIIVAIDQKRGIGRDNKLMWNIPEDLARFKKITSGHTIIMGRKTFDSIGRPLPNRTNIVISRNPSFARPGLARGGLENLIVVHSLEEAIERAKREEILKPSQTWKQVQDDIKREVFIIGGGQIFEQSINLADKLYLTIVEGDFGADTFFPDYSMFKKVIHEESRESGKYKYKFLELER